VKGLIALVMLCALALSAYSCAYQCVAVPPPGGFSYGETAEKGGQGDKR
jgi:hypothetical protein